MALMSVRKSRLVPSQSEKWGEGPCHVHPCLARQGCTWTVFGIRAYHVDEVLEQDALECCALPAMRGRMAFKVNDEHRRFQRIRKWSNL